MTASPELTPASGVLLSIPGATPGTTQWRARTLQLVNWGGFENHQRLELHPGANLISGASGSGKSTLLDAYLALMMPADVPFNGASNTATGRARGAEQRNLLSYLRGQIDTTSDETGQERPTVLRGQTRATWGAVAMTFVNDHGALFTAARVFYASPSAGTDSELVRRMVTFDGYLNLPDLEPLVARQFPPKELRTTFPGLATHSTYTEFADRLGTRLGIGVGGEAVKALRLLARIQAGQQIRTVDNLYKKMVLDTPKTFAAADKALAHFDDLEKAYNAMVDEQHKVDLLTGIDEHHQDLVNAQATIDQIDTYGLTSAGDTAFTLWVATRKHALLQAAIDQNHTARKTAAEQYTRACGVVDDLERSLAAARAEHHAAGGGNVQVLEADLRAAERELDARTTRLGKFAANARMLNLTMDTPQAFHTAQADANTFLAAYPHTLKTLGERRNEVYSAYHDAQTAYAEVHAEYEHMKDRDTTIPRWLHNLRTQVIQATGWQTTDVPFLAELVDVPEEHRPWRTAIETVLRGEATWLLVPEDRFQELSRLIDPLPFRRRLRFRSVPTHVHATANPDPDRVAGKLIYNEQSPFIGWVKQHLSHQSRNYLCVPGPDGLNGPGPRVTRAGQTRNGTTGSHGRDSAVNFLGFDNTERLAELDTERRHLAEKVAAHKAELGDIDTEIHTLAQQRDAHRAVAAVTFDDIDVWSAQQRIDDLTTAREELLAASDQLRALQTRLERLEADLYTANRARWEIETEQAQLHTEWETLVADQDRVGDVLERITSTQQVHLTPEQTDHLDTELAQLVPADRLDVDTFDHCVPRLRDRLLASVRTAEQSVRAATSALEGAFRDYKAKFSAPNLGDTVASYPDYAQILDEIRTTGLHERRAQWRHRLMEWSGEDLVPLSQAMDRALNEINDRLDSVNGVLRHLPFGPTGDRLKIYPRRLNTDKVATFRRQLRAWASAATHTVPEDELEGRFRALQQFMGRLRSPEDPSYDPNLSERTELLDVNQHVEITARRFDAAGNEVATHSHLGGKSGGETQELIAFIVGAALRFQLGDEDRARPRFAPVLLDEAFIKADGQFAGRAVQAWKGLGFQLIIGAPIDKVTALEPHMDQVIAVTKDLEQSYSHVTTLRDTPAAT